MLGDAKRTYYVRTLEKYKRLRFTIHFTRTYCQSGSLGRLSVTILRAFYSNSVPVNDCEKRLAEFVLFKLRFARFGEN